VIVPTPNVGKVNRSIPSDNEVTQDHQPERRSYQIQIPPFHILQRDRDYRELDQI